MDYSLRSDKIKTLQSDCILVGVYENQILSEAAAQLDQALDGFIEAYFKQADFNGKLGQTRLLYTTDNTSISRVLLVGLGEKSALNLSQYKKALANAARTLFFAEGVQTLTVCVENLEVADLSAYEKIRSAVQVLEYESYQNQTYKSEPQLKPRPAHIVFQASTSVQQEAERALEHGQSIAKAINQARTLGNMPPNFCTPTFLAQHAKAMAKRHKKVNCEVLDEAALTRLGANTILAVGRGSVEESHLIVLHYQGAQADEAPIALVGKGVTFDTGGTNVKTAMGMQHMKLDMCGAASVLSIFESAVELALPLNLYCVVPAVLNTQDGNALIPTDVITTLSGKTVEVINTDAEGRLILCDALTYCEQFKPRAVIDMATLTGAIVASLAHERAGLFGNDDALQKALFEAGEKTNDPAWIMPMDDVYFEPLKSKTADFANAKLGSPAASISAAKFLSKFTEQYPWAHFDIAGTASKNGQATGKTVSLMIEYLLQQADEV